MNGKYIFINIKRLLINLNSIYIKINRWISEYRFNNARQLLVKFTLNLFSTHLIEFFSNPDFYRDLCIPMIK